MIKKTVIGSILAAASLVANEPSTVNNGTYATVSYAKVSGGGEKIMHIQPLSEIVGDSESITKVSIGVENRDTDGSFLAGSRIGVYLSTSSCDGGADGFAGGIEFAVKGSNVSPIRPYLSGSAGIGSKDDKDRQIHLSTNVNVVNEITSTDGNYDQYKGDYIGVIEDNTQWLELEMEVGAEISLGKNLDLDVGYQYHVRNYQISYRVEGDSVLNSVTEASGYHGVSAKVKYSF